MRKQSGMADDVCAICHDTFEEGGGVHELECGHKFHTACIVPWFRNGHASCPTCRDVRQNVCGLFWYDRARLLMRKSRNKNAPTELKLAVEKIRKVKSREQALKRELSEYKMAHKEVLAKHRQLKQRLWRSTREEYSMRRSLGMMDIVGYRLPPLIVHAHPYYNN